MGADAVETDAATTVGYELGQDPGSRRHAPGRWCRAMPPLLDSAAAVRIIDVVFFPLRRTRRMTYETYMAG